MIVDEASFRRYLKKTGHTEQRCDYEVHNVQRYEGYLSRHRNKKLGEETPEDLTSFVEWAKGRKEKGSAQGNILLFVLARYYNSISDDSMFCAVQERIGMEFTKKANLKDFLGVNHQHTQALRKEGISTSEHMLKAGRTDEGRRKLSEETGVPFDAIMELVKLADLSRIGGLARKRARLYYDAGLDTLDKIAGWDSEKMQRMFVEFVERTGFGGSSPTPSEAAFTVKLARYLPRIVEY